MAVDLEPVSAQALELVERPMMVQQWRWMTFLHWRYTVAQLRPLVPDELDIDTFDGSAWVGLLPFQMHVRLPGLPPVPWASNFPETNLRTYVIDRHGRRGIWFFSLDADRLGAVAMAQAGLRLPYRWARMRVSREDDSVRYSSRRHGPGTQAKNRVRIFLLDRIPDAEVSELELFLTARWRLYNRIGERLIDVPAEHPMWSLRHAVLDTCESELFAAEGVPPPQGEPLVHFSEGVEVKIGRPRTV